MHYCQSQSGACRISSDPVTRCLRGTKPYSRATAIDTHARRTPLVSLLTFLVSLIALDFSS